MTAPLPEGPWSIVYADPAWSYDNRVQHGGAGKPFTSSAASRYRPDETTGRSTMTPDEIRAMPVKSIIAPKAICFLWVTGPQLDVGLTVLPAWGFKYKTVAFVWNKCRVNPGAYTMSQTEFVLVGARGSIPKPRGARNERQWIGPDEIETETDLVVSPRRAHSEKPVEVRRRIDRMFPDPSLRRVELFARSNPDTGCPWTVWGDEAPA